MQENPQYGKFRQNGLPFANELTTLFKDVIAIGKFVWAPSFEILPNGIDEDDDGYRPFFESGCVDLEEGWGDNEECSRASAGASVGVSPKLRHINSSQDNYSQVSSGKRKKIGGCEMVEKKKRVKVPASKQIADALTRIAYASESRSMVLRSLIVPGTSIGEVMVEIQKMDVITSDLDWHFRCCQLMLFKPAREMFVSLQGYNQRLLDWLKHAAYNPLPFMKN